MAIDEVEGETCEITNIISSIIIAPDDNQLYKEKSEKETPEGTINDINYIDEDVIILESSPSKTILILDDDAEHEQVNNVGYSTYLKRSHRLHSHKENTVENNVDQSHFDFNVFKSKNDSHPINEILHTIFPESCDLNQSQHGILEKDFDNFCINVMPPLRQYGRKQKKTPERHNSLLSSSTQEASLESADISDMNIDNRYLPGYQIQNEQGSDGLKELSEISAIFCHTPSKTPTELEDGVVTSTAKDKFRETFETEVPSTTRNVLDAEDCIAQSDPETEQQVHVDEEEDDKAEHNCSDQLKTSSYISGCSLVCTYPKLKHEPIINDIPANSKFSCVETMSPSYKNSSREDMTHLQPFHEEAYVETNRESTEELEKSKDIKFYLNKIFKTSSLNSKEALPLVVKMKDNPIIISENGVVTVIYKPEKIKIRREKEIPEPVPRERSSSGKGKTQETTFKRKEPCSSGMAQVKQALVELKQEINNHVRKGITKTKKEDTRFSGVKRQQITGIRWTKKKYPPLCKVNYRGEMVYKCKDCDFVHPDCVAAVRRHMIRHQAADSIDWFYCDLCSYKAKRKGNLKIHMILHRNPDDVVWYKCEMCDKRFKHRNGLYSHEKRHLKRDELELYLCDQCSYKTPFKHTLLRHKMNHDSVEKKKRLSCNMCSYSTYNKYYLSRHKKQTHREPTYKCLLCNYQAKYKANLESHLKKHFPQDEVFCCDSCNFSTNRRYTLTMHNKNVHNIYSSPENQMFFCYNCSYHTRFKRCLAKHMSIHSGTQGSKEMCVKIKTELITD